MNRRERIAKFEDFCRKEPDIPVFYQPWFLDAVSQPGSWDVVLSEKNNEVLAAFPFHVRKKWGSTLHLMPQLCKYGGPFLGNNARDKGGSSVVRDLLKKMPESHASILHLHPNMPYGLPFLWAGYHLENQYTYILEGISDLKQTFNSLSASYRNNKIGKAKNLVEVVMDPNIEAFYQVNALSFQRQKMDPPYTLEFIKDLDQTLAENNARTVFFARDEEGRIYSTLYLVHDRTAAYLLMTGDDPEFRKSGSGIYLTWKAIEYSSRELGLDRFDFLGSMIPGVARVRKQFGAKPVSYLKVSRFNGLRGSLIKHGFHLLKKA